MSPRPARRDRRCAVLTAFAALGLAVAAAVARAEIFVADASDVEVFADGADGNVAPLRQIEGLNSAYHVTMDPGQVPSASEFPGAASAPLGSSSGPRRAPRGPASSSAPGKSGSAACATSVASGSRSSRERTMRA